MATTANSQPADSPEVRRYNRVQRWLSMADAVIGFALLVVLLVTGWTGKLRDWSYLGSKQHYFLAVFFYVLMFSVIAKVLNAPFDFVGFRLEHQYHLSNQKLRSWLWDECKGWLVSLVLGTIMVELVYAIIRLAPQRWWIIAWAVFVGLFLLMAQLAPVVLMPIFYKFEPLANDSLRERLTRLGERAGTRVRGVYEWKLSEKSKKANAALTGMGSTRRIILSDTLLQHYSDDEIEAVLAHELGHRVHRHILKGILMQVGMWFGYVTFGFISDAAGRKRTYVFFLFAAALLVPLYARAQSATLLIVGPLLAFFGTGHFTGFGAMTAELFPTSFRATAMGLTYNFGRALSAAAPWAIGAIAARGGLSSAFGISGVAFLLAGVLALALPETRGRRLVE